jgi:deoxyadenosine/deoxycytidine kinase
MSGTAVYVGISGNIGVGKSQLTKVLSDRLDWDAYYEPVIENPYLEDFYADMARYSFHLQIFFLSERFRAMQDCLSASRSLIQDRTLYEDGEIFAPTLRDLGMLTERDYQNYRALYETLLSTVRPPDMILLLTAPTEVLLERIRRRDRAFERHVDAAYLEDLERRYEDWAGRISEKVPVRRIDTSRLDLEGRGGELDRLVGDLEGWSRGIGR